jgi:hypothetical protein
VRSVIDRSQGPTRDVSEELREDVLAEEPYLVDVIGQACHLETTSARPPLSSSSLAASWAIWVGSRM